MHPLITNSGIGRANSKFRPVEPSKSSQSLFQVPDIDSETDIQFIAEPFDKISEEPSKFSCPNCEHTIEIAYNLDAEFDYTRINAIKKFHSNIFTNFKEKTNNA